MGGGIQSIKRTLSLLYDRYKGVRLHLNSEQEEELASVNGSRHQVRRGLTPPSGCALPGAPSEHPLAEAGGLLTAKSRLKGICLKAVVLSPLPPRFPLTRSSKVSRVGLQIVEGRYLRDLACHRNTL